MNKSLIPKVCELLGVTIGEEFNFCGYRKNIVLDEDGYVLEPTDSGEWEKSKNFTLADLLRVPHKIRKLPFKPKKGEYYWTFGIRDSVLTVICRDWSDILLDFFRLKCECVFQTQIEAVTALPNFAKEMGMDYDHDL